MKNVWKHVTDQRLAIVSVLFLALTVLVGYWTMTHEFVRPTNFEQNYDTSDSVNYDLIRSIMVQERPECPDVLYTVPVGDGRVRHHYNFPVRPLHGCAQYGEGHICKDMTTGEFFYGEQAECLVKVWDMANKKQLCNI